MAYIPLGALMPAITYSARHSKDELEHENKEAYWIKHERLMTDWYECSNCHEFYVCNSILCPNCKCFML